MNLKFVPAAALAAFCFTLPCIAQTAATPLQTPGGSATEPLKMVPAQVQLKETLDGKKLQSGDTFHAVVTGKIHLQNGTELPAGTILTGRIADDDMQIDGTSKVALRFDTATLKSGQVIPIKATVVNLSQTATTSNAAVPSTWSDGSLKVDQMDAASGVTMHSATASKNSGLFVADKGKTVRLKAGMDLSLAVAAGPAMQPVAADQPAVAR